MRARLRRWTLALAVLSFPLSCSDPPHDGGDGAGGDPAVGSGVLGARCEVDADCATGLCHPEQTALLGSGGPPGGICTAACEGEEACPVGSWCTATSTGARCLLACDFGSDGSKCGGRDELACEPLLVPSERSCLEDSECEFDELCFEAEGGGICQRVLGICTSRCAGDEDCSGGRFCDRASGECVEAAPQGLAVGESCDPQKDECLGDCVEIGSGIGECEERCRIGAEAGCGLETLAGSALVCGFFAYDLGDLGIEQGAGDTGICAVLCDCNDDCPGEQRCLDNPVGEHAGICAGGLDPGDSLPCDSGEGGAGGGSP